MPPSVLVDMVHLDDVAVRIVKENLVPAVHRTHVETTPHPSNLFDPDLANWSEGWGRTFWVLAA